MRIGVNALYLIPGAVGGTEIYLRFLLDAFSRSQGDHEFLVFVNRESEPDLVPDSARLRIVRCPVRATFRPARILYEQFVLPGLLERNDIDVLLNPGFTAPLFTACPQVTIFHDLQHVKHPQHFSRFDLPFWNLLLAGAAARSNRLIAISDNTARDLAAAYPSSTDKIAVIPNGVDPEFFRMTRDTPARGPFILTVSTLHPHKNLFRLMEAFKEFRGSHPEYRLVVVGLRGFAAKAVEQRIADLGVGEHVTLTGWIPRDEVYALFRTADAFVAPSTFEGFGMPLAEALAAGLPTACSSIPPFHEIAGDAAQFFNPESVGEIVRGMETAVSDPAFRERALRSGPARAGAFDWKTTASGILAQCEIAPRAR